VVPEGPKIDEVCSSDAVSILGVTNRCRKFVTHVADAFIESGEIAERRTEDKERLEGGPAALARVITFDPTDEAQVVWSSGAVKVSAITEQQQLLTPPAIAPSIASVITRVWG
jgi:ribonuclease Z